VSPTAGLDEVEERINIPCRESDPPNPNRSARSQSVYRLSYPGS